MSSTGHDACRIVMLLFIETWMIVGFGFGAASPMTSLSEFSLPAPSYPFDSPLLHGFSFTPFTFRHSCLSSLHFTSCYFIFSFNLISPSYRSNIRSTSCSKPQNILGLATMSTTESVTVTAMLEALINPEKADELELNEV